MQLIFISTVKKPSVVLKKQDILSHDKATANQNQPIFYNYKNNYATGLKAKKTPCFGETHGG
jgi:hypothetical protein